MGNLGMPELIMILVLALLLFGPKKLPEIGKQVGRALGEFKRTSNELKRTIEDEMEKAGLDQPKTGPPPPDPTPAPAAHPADTVASEASPGAAPGTGSRPSCARRVEIRGRKKNVIRVGLSRA